MATRTVGHLEKVRALAASGSMLAIGGTRTGEKSSLTLYDTATHKVARTIDLPSHVWALCFAGEKVIAGCADGRLRTFHAGTGEAGTEVLAHAGGCTAVACSPDGAALATAGVDGAARLWTTDALTSGRAWNLSSQPLRAVAFDGARLAAAGDDGVVRLVPLSGEGQRDMAGHIGPVFALSFTPRDGRLASAGDDGTVRFWFLEGAVEAEIRGANEQGHAGGAFALQFGPVAGDQPDATDRLFSAGADSKVKVWRLDERRKPKTYELLDAVRALTIVAPSAGTREGKLGTLVAGGDGRTLLFVPIGADGQPLDSTDLGEHGFRVLEQQAAGNQPPGRQAAARKLATLEEPEALALLQKLLSGDKDVGVRALAAELLGKHLRRDARPALRERLDDPHPKVRDAALNALVALEPENPVMALRAGLASKFADVRRGSVSLLPSHYPASLLVPGLIQGALADGDGEVRMAALEALVRIHPASSFDPFRIAFERGTPDLRVEAMARALMLGAAHHPAVVWMTGRALDDADTNVRRLAFVVRVATCSALVGFLEPRFGDFPHLLTHLLRRVALARRTAPAKEVTEEELAGAREAIGLAGAPADTLQEFELEPLLSAIASKSSDISLMGTTALLSLTRDWRAIGALLQLSRDPSGEIRAIVARVLASVPVTEAEQRLVAMLEDSEVSVRSAAAEAWAERAKQQRPLDFSRGLLRSAFEDVRVRGLSALVQEKRSAEAEALLEQALEDESAKVRAEAFRTLWSWEQQKPEAALDRVLAARFADLRLRAVEELSLLAKVPRDDESKPPATPPAWAVERLKKAVADRDPQVGLKSFESVRRLTGSENALAVNLGLDSTVPEVRTTAAQWAAKVKRDQAEVLRTPLLKALQALELTVRLAALEALDLLFPSESGPLTAGLLTDELELKVRAAELLAKRRDEVIVDPMRALLLDRELLRFAPERIQPLRERAAHALASLGSPRCNALFAETLLKDENPGVREQASRGLCNSGEKEATGPLLDALGHQDVAVRSWSAEGLARLGDTRGLPVLTGTLRDPHLPIREGAIRALVALGEEGNSGLVAGLDDPERYLQETFFSVLLARDWKAFRQQQGPELLTAALSSRQVEIRFAAARALELRTGAEPYTDHLVELLLPPKPEKAAETKDWPPEAEREHLMVALADMLGAESPADRYAAGQALLLRRRPLEYFAEVRRITRLKPTGATVVPDTTPRAPVKDSKQKKDWLRSLFASRAKAADVNAEIAQLHWLAFGAYVGILRDRSEGEVSPRVRRDSVDRIVALAQSGQPPVTSAVPPLARALEDDDHLVRRQAYAGLKRLFGDDPQDMAVRYALTSASPDVANAALDELASRGSAGIPFISSMLSNSLAPVRKHAFELLVRLHPAGSLDPLLAAFSCQHADLRLGVVERLAASSDPRVTDALLRALESEHQDLRLRAAELLADRGDDRVVAVLAALLRSEEDPVCGRALRALRQLCTPAAIQALSARLDEVTANPIRQAFIATLGYAGVVQGAEALLKQLSNPEVDLQAFEAGMTIGHFWSPNPEDPEEDGKKAKQTPRDGATLLRFFEAAVKSKRPELRLAAAERMHVGPEKELDGLLVSLFTDRDPAVRTMAVTRYATRVEKQGSPVAPLEEVLRQGARELMLPAAEGLSHSHHVAAYRPLLLFARAGEGGERERALRALGTLGDPRALDELETIASGGTAEVPYDLSMQEAALEALGRLSSHLSDPDRRQKVWERIEGAAMDGPLQGAAILALQAIGDGRACARLSQLALSSGLPELPRLQAVDALGRMGNKAAEETLAQCLKVNHTGLRRRAKRALVRLFPNDAMRVAQLAAESPHPDIAAPAIAYLVAEAEPEGVLARLAGPLDAKLRESIRFGLVKREALPTQPLVKLTESPLPAAREDVAWLMALHALSSSALTPQERAERAQALARAALATADRWSRALETEKAAEARAWRRLLWAATLNAAQSVLPAAKAVLSSDVAPAVVRREAVRALVRAGDPKVVDALAAATQDRDAAVRRSAIAGLVKVDGSRARSLIGSVKPLDAAAFYQAADAQLLTAAAGRQVTLPVLVARSETDQLKKLAQTGPTEAEQLSALAALGRIGGEDVVSFLSSLAFTGERSEEEDEPEEEEEEESEDGGSGDVTLPGARRFEFVEDGSSKFWEVVVSGKDFTVRYGKIGTAGQSKTKSLASPAAAQKEADKLVKEKTGKGYQEVKPRGRKPLAAVKESDARQSKEGGAGWGNETLRKAAFRALKRAERITARRASAPSWFSPAEIDALVQQSQAALVSGESAPNEEELETEEEDESEELEEEDAGDEDEEGEGEDVEEEDEDEEEADDE